MDNHTLSKVVNEILNLFMDNTSTQFSYVEAMGDIFVEKKIWTTYSRTPKNALCQNSKNSHSLVMKKSLLKILTPTHPSCTTGWSNIDTNSSLLHYLMVKH